ncbi:hypothetical protein ADJ73_02300 [Arsenicicoccus sp. oral taxon 190]|nr:hypothetical protein ADJ73_02300 [Arsenicicoccus sp. oral taxon 190]
MALALGAAGCTTDTPSSRDVAQAYAEGLARLDLTGVALDGTDAATATTALQSLGTPLGERRPRVTVVDGGSDEGDSTTARLSVSWQLGPAQPWSYETSVPLVRKDGRWRATWSPATVVPGAAAGDSLAVTRTPATRGRVLGAGGTPIVQPRPVVRVGVDKAHVTPQQAEAAAPRVAAFAGLDDVAGYTARVRGAGPRAFVEAITLRRDDPQAKGIDALVASVPGVTAVDDQRPLAPTRTFARPILGSVGEATAEIVQASHGAIAAGDVVGLGGLQRSEDETLRGTPGLRVALRHAGATNPLYAADPVAGRDVSTTLDVSVQTRAEQLLAAVKPASAVVALRPSTGDVLAAASGPGGQGQSTATLGKYAPGSTFKIVSTLALLRAGRSSTTPVACTPTVAVDGRVFENYDAYPADGLGQVPLATAFAKSCNTAFISQRDAASSSEIARAAAGLGLTASPALGVPGFLGSVPDATSQTEHAAQMIGQSQITASPLGMATVAASVVAGRPVAPRIVIPAAGAGATTPGTGTTPGAAETSTAPSASTTPAPPAAPVTPAEAAALRSLMRGVVTGGSGELLRRLPGEVLAKTGTAEFGTTTPPRKHAWMVAARGDLAVAVFVDEGEGGSRTAGPILKSFLEGTP